MLSRGVAGVRGTTLIVNLPGSPGAVRDGLEVLSGVVQHVVDLLRDAADAHGRPNSSTPRPNTISPASSAGSTRA
jgi:hypothetical protein